MPDPMSFDRNAEVHARARPAYPPRLYELLAEHGVLSPGARLLEIGAGTGQATGELVAAGAAVTAIEPRSALAGAYDAAVSATAFHWVDREVVLPKLHRALVPHGLLAVWAFSFRDPEAPVTPLRREVARIASGRPGPRRERTDPLDTAGWSAHLGEGGWFTTEHAELLRFSVELTVDQVHDLFSTFSDWTSAEVDDVAAAAASLVGPPGCRCRVPPSGHRLT